MSDTRDLTTTDGGERQMTAAQRRQYEEAQELKSLVADRINRVELAMPTHIGPWLEQSKISPAVFLSSYRLAMAKNPEIARCTPVSLMLALMDSAKIGLPPDGKKAAIVPYKGEATFVPMRDGIVDVLGRAGYHVSAQVIYEGEDDPEILDYDLGSDPYVRFKPPLNRSDASKVIAAFAVFTAKEGNGKWVELCSENDLKKIRRMSKTDKVRNNWAGEMDRKAPLRRGAKFLPSHPELDMLNAIETKAYHVSPPPMDAPAKRLSDDALLDDAVDVGGGIIEHDSPAEDPRDREEMSLIHRFTQMLATAPDLETLEDRAAAVLADLDYDTLPPEEKAVFEMTLRMQREEYGADPEALVGEAVEEVAEGVVRALEHKTGRPRHFVTGAEFQAFMLETLAKGDSTSLHHWWSANEEPLQAAAELWPEHAERIRMVASGKGLGE